MSNVSVIKSERSPPPLVRSLRNGIIEGFNRTVELRRIDKSTVNCMVSFLAASSIACNATGNRDAALLFQQAGEVLGRDWRRYETVIRTLVDNLRGFV